MSGASLIALLRASYYGGLALLIMLIVNGVVPDIFKDVSENNEGFVFALLLPLWIEFARPRLADTRLQWPLTLLAAALCLVVGTLLYRTEGALGGFKTLNEPVLALAVLIPYVQLRRPLPRHAGLLAAALVIAIVVVGERTTVVTRLAEGFGLLILTPLTFDVVDRQLLDRSAASSSARRAGWYALLLVLPMVFSLLNKGLDGGPSEAFLGYAVRLQESFVGMWLVGVYLVLVAMCRRSETSTPPLPANVV